MGCSSSKEASSAAVVKEPPTNTSGSTTANGSAPSTATPSGAAASLKSDPNNNFTATSKKELLNGGDVIAEDPHPFPQTDTLVTEGPTQLRLGKVALRYAAVSRHGKDLEIKDKPNQDCFSVHPQYCNDKKNAFFGVYDGHGPTGELCSQFARRRVPALIEKYINEDFTEELGHHLKQAHIACNDELHSNSSINDSYSGTTAINVYVEGDAHRITVSNVGDSRAILGTNRVGNAWMALPLSTDQTPRRPDEAARCKQKGARILSFGEINPPSVPPSDNEEEEEDPPRVWSKDGKYPGTAFTRSIGDAVADTLGVFAEPEMMTLKLSPKEKCIVLASDGVWDVLQNQQVIDTCCQYYHKNGADSGPLAACHAIVTKSHDEWLLNEDCNEEQANYDDMTVVCIFIDGVGDNIDDDAINASPETAAAVDNTAESTDADADAEHARPEHHRKRVRQKTLRNLEEMNENA